MRKLLTDLAIQHLPPGMYWDEKLPGFGIRVGKKTRTFAIVQGPARKVSTIGRYPDISLQEAKKQARVALLSPNETHPDLDYAEASKAFLEAMARRLKPNTVSQYAYYLEKCAFKTLPPSRADITEKLRLFDGKAWSQNYAYAALRCFLNWCLEQEYIDKHPLIRGREPNKTKSRDRVLSDEELGRIWRCTEDNTYGRILRLLLLTGQRRMEVKNLKPQDVADGLITFHTKGDKINVLPITPLVQENLTLPFKFNDWGGAKARFDTDCGVDFRHHDLRRTLATKLAGMGVDFVVIERVLGHARSGVAYTYNRHSYLPEVKKALVLYEDHIRKVMETA